MASLRSDPEFRQNYPLPSGTLMWYSTSQIHARDLLRSPRHLLCHHADLLGRIRPGHLTRTNGRELLHASGRDVGPRAYHVDLSLRLSGGLFVRLRKLLDRSHRMATTFGWRKIAHMDDVWSAWLDCRDAWARHGWTLTESPCSEREQAELTARMFAQHLRGRE